MFCTTKVTELENSAVRVQQKVLRFDVTMTNSMRVNVRERPATNTLAPGWVRQSRDQPEELIHVQFDECDGYGLLLFAVLPGHLVHGLWDVLQHEVQVDLVLLLAAGVEKIQEADDVAVVQSPHDLELSVLKPEEENVDDDVTLLG